MGQLKTRIAILGALVVAAAVWVLQDRRTGVSSPVDRLNPTAADTTTAFLKRTAKLRQESRERKQAEMGLLSFETPLDTEPQRQEFYDRLVKTSPDKLYAAWKGSLDSPKERHKGLLEVALADNLKLTKGSAEAQEVFQQAGKFLMDPNERVGQNPPGEVAGTKRLPGGAQAHAGQSRGQPNGRTEIGTAAAGCERR